MPPEHPTDLRLSSSSLLLSTLQLSDTKVYAPYIRLKALVVRGSWLSSNVLAGSELIEGLGGGRGGTFYGQKAPFVGRRFRACARIQIQGQLGRGM